LNRESQPFEEWLEFQLLGPVVEHHDSRCHQFDVGSRSVFARADTISPDQATEDGGTGWNAQSELLVTWIRIVGLDARVNIQNRIPSLGV
jgi:hypothetical protein